MKIEIGQPLSHQLRKFLRDFTTAEDLRNIETLTGVGFFSLRDMKAEDQTDKKGKIIRGRVTNFTKTAVVPLLKLAIKNKMDWSVTTREEISMAEKKVAQLLNEIHEHNSREVVVKESLSVWSQNVMK